MERDWNRELLSFIEASPTAFHAVKELETMLEKAGYQRLREEEPWTLSFPGKYFVTRNGSSLIALDLPERFDSYMMMAAHTDSPSFRIKADGEEKVLGLYSRLGVEKYGGMLCNTWMDRPLSIAGRVMVRQGDKLVCRLVKFERDLVLIPNLAIHMDRSANDGKVFNVNEDMMPLIGSFELQRSVNSLIAEELGIRAEDIVSRELNLYARTPGSIWGADREYISAPHLDDLMCVFGCLQGFLSKTALKQAAVFVALDNEEVGSSTRQGADSSFLEDTLRRVWSASGRSDAEYRQALAGSFMVSADNAHAVHPNHPEFADRNERPTMNGGIVLKYNANQRYVTDAVSAGVFTEICRRAGVPVQHYSNRPDLQGGATLGNISLTHVAVRALDIGLAQLAMHSSYETAGAKDTEYLIRAARLFYSSSLLWQGDSVTIL